MALSVWTQQQVLNQLDSGNHWSNNTITYAFPTSSSSINGGSGEAYGFVGLNATQQTYAQLALQTWDDLIVADLQQTTSRSSNIEFGNSSTGVEYAQAYFPTDGSVWFNRSYSELMSPQVGEYSFLTFVHEIGHSLGLDHMGDYNGSGSWSPSSYQDSTVYSVMSYFGPSQGSGSSNGEGLVAWADWVGSDGRTHSPQTPMLNDIMAIQSMYGAETTTRTGDTVYGFGSNISGSVQQIYDFAINLFPIMCIYDSAGTDTLNLSGWTTSSVINLAPGSYSSCASMTYNISIAYTCNIENAVGGGGNDTITGNALANLLDGGSGRDIISGGGGNDIVLAGLGNDDIDGGAGSDTVVFSGAWSSYSYSYNANGDLVFSSSLTGTDTLRGVETVQFSDVTKSVTNLTGGTPTTSTTVSIAANSASVIEGNSGTTTVSFLVSLSAAAAGAQSVSWSLTGATNASDFSGLTSGTIAFAAGELQKSISIQIAGDTTLESDEAFSVNLSNPTSGLTLGTASAAMTIINDDQVTTGGDDYPWSPNTNGVVTVNAGIQTGAIETNGDGDMFKVALVAGTTYEFNLQATANSLDPYLELYGTSVQLLSSNDDAGGSTLDSRIVYTAATTGTYYLGVRDFSSGTGTYTLSASSNTGTGTGTGTTLYGNDYANTLTGGTGDDSLYGLGGNDTLTGNGNNDYLDGGTGSDRMSGGNGNDTYIVDNTGDTVIESSSTGGVDLVIASVTYGLANYVENLTLSGNGNTTATGNSLANTLIGNDSNNTLYGQGGDDVLLGGNGNDRLAGGTGNDSMTGGAGADLFRFDSALSAFNNVDTLVDFQSGNDQIYLENGIFTRLFSTGYLSNTNFSSNATGRAMDSNDYVVYNTTNGNLYYDYDGSGAGAAVQFATLTGVPTLSASDFMVI